MPSPLPAEATTVEPITPRSRTYYVEVTHHGWFAGAMIQGKQRATEARDRMLADLRARCATTGPRTAPPSDSLTDESRCPDV